MYNADYVTTTMAALPQQRAYILERLSEACARHPMWPSVDPEKQPKYAALLEKSCINMAVKKAQEQDIDNRFTNQRFLELYSSISAKLMLNLDCTSSVGSTALGDAIFSGKVHPGYAAELTSMEMCPEASRREVEEIRRREGQKHKQTKSRLYVCKCGKRNIDLTEHQTRSADELPTYTAECRSCGLSWRVH